MSGKPDPSAGPADDWVSAIRRTDPRYDRAAFDFVQQALRLAHRRAGREGHVSGRELLAAFRELAVAQFGPLARSVLEEWNVRSTEDVGHIVFLCVEAGEMGKTDQDSMDDFRGIFDFGAAFPSEPGDVKVARAPREDDEGEDGADAGEPDGDDVGDEDADDDAEDDD